MSIWFLYIAADAFFLFVGMVIAIWVKWAVEARLRRRKAARRRGYVSVSMPIFDDQLEPMDLIK